MKKSLLKVTHETAKGLFKIGLMNESTMRSFDIKCAPSVRKLKPSEIKKIRLREKITQADFAIFLNISLLTVKRWEKGITRPRGTALKLLNILANQGLQAILI